MAKKNKSSDYFRTMIAGLDIDTTMAVDGKSSAEFSGFIDTGSYTLNALLSGSLFGGMPNNKVLALAGESTTGKSLFTLGIVRNFLNQHPDGGVIYFDTESAITNQMLSAQGIDLHRVIKSEPETLEQFKHRAVTILDKYMKQEPDERQPLLLVLDSLGNLSSSKEIGDTLEGKEVKDMTKPGLIRGIFRVLRLRLGRANVPMIVTNHVYEKVGAYVPTKVMSGGHGLIYTSDTIAFLSKRADRDEDKNILGNIITVKMQKSRLSREGCQGETKISYTAGLSRYHGLFDWGVAAQLIVKTGNKYQFPDGQSAFQKAIHANPEKFFTPDFLKRLDEEYVAKKFRYLTEEPVFDDSELEEA
jgi:RecA/RadA recombinase